jgi:signal transduction histidine kinase
MQIDTLEPTRVFRTAAWIWIGYLASLAFVDLFIYASQLMSPVLWYHLINCLPALLFLGLSYSKLIRIHSRVMIPLMILLISLAPLLLNHLFDLRLPAAPLSNLEGMVLRQLPVLFVSIVLVAWHYNLTITLAYCVLTFIFEVYIVVTLNPFRGDQQTVFYFVAAIRTISLAVVGIFINQLITILRTQQEALRSANRELAHHASVLETLAISRERNRLARELHDTLAHTLSGLTVQLETAKAYWKVRPETTYQLLVDSLATARSGLDETRRALKALRASPLDDLGLLLAIKKLSQTAAERGRLTLYLTLPEQLPALSPDIEHCIYRITQEALENVINHANAQKLSVALTANDSQITLVVQDDGQGSEQIQTGQEGHFGLVGMQERAELAGGSLTIQSVPGQGTRLQLEIKAD